MAKKEGLSKLSFVEIDSSDGVFRGILLPSSNDETLFLKLDSGYNIGISRKKVKNMKKLENVTFEEKIKAPIPRNPKLKNITILHTGGTIASEVDYKTGAVTSRFSPEEIVMMFPELEGIVNIDSRLIRNMFSDDMNIPHYNILAKEIEKEVKKGVDGIIITHGTDTMHYTSAALSFILEDLPIPVILTGSQRSSDRGSTDGGFNLACAARFIAQSNLAGVAICMHASSSDDFCNIIHGCKARKLHSSRRDAFKSVNDDPIARVSKANVEFIKKEHKQRDSKLKLRLRLFDEKVKVGLLKAHPGMKADEITFYSKYDGLILEGTGLGHFPVSKIDEFTSENDKIYNEIKKLSSKIPVAMTSQCIFGQIDLDVYSNGKKLLGAGVIGNQLSMTPETAYIKLLWLIGNHDKKDIKALFSRNLRGEISERILIKKDFLK
ncbi:MAG TPA: Glu-tRNA(Gln) amidotransferase subunit GatD [Candidatus Nanoarchaeia archaeon]|nr:Glu-tRNA(Gln) amidotransferase subunit GatD [Candidatus Nanoarchaeia archaeon]